MSVGSKILTPIGYAFIKHSEKRWFDLWLPLITSGLILLIIAALPKSISFIGKDSLISLVNGMLQILSGFYIASMAAVATFQKSGMDDVMSGTPPKLKGKNLTRRQFLTYLFGFLAFMSIVLYFLGGAIQLSSASIKDMHFVTNSVIKYSAMYVYLFLVSNILFTTALGMFFMIDKMHEDKKQLKITPPTE